MAIAFFNRFKSYGVHVSQHVANRNLPIVCSDMFQQTIQQHILWEYDTENHTEKHDDTENCDNEK